MGLILSGQEKLFFDTAPFICFFERHENFGPKVRDFLLRKDVQHCTWATSVITLIEVLTAPRRQGEAGLEKLYADFFHDSNRIDLAVLNVDISQKAVHFRAEYGFKTPDSIQLATAQAIGADVVITNDHAWKKVNELRVVTVDEL